MVNIEQYISQLTRRLQQSFGPGLLYVGLQGSYLRGEATENSDIDVMVVLDELTAARMDQYREVLQSLEHFDKACGFLCSREDLAHWNPLEICHLLHTTRDCFGALSDLTPAYTDEDVRSFIKLSIGNLYHELCHRYIYRGPEKSAAGLPGTFKGVFFILQNLHYLRTGSFVQTKKELLPLLEGKDKTVLQRSLELSRGADFAFADNFDLLLTLCQETLKSL